MTARAEETLELPSLREMAHYAAPAVIWGTLFPTVVFWGALELLGPTAAMALTSVALYAVIFIRNGRQARVPMVVVLGALLLTARTIISLATGSVYFYFLQPTLGTVLGSLAFLASIPIGKPLALRFAADVVPLPDAVRERPWLTTVFTRITLLWGVMLGLNAAVSLYLLGTQSVGSFVWLRSAVSTGIGAIAILASVVLFLVTARRAGTHISFGVS